MRIIFERSGGFAGMRIQAEIDTQDLAPEQAQELEQLVREADLSSLSAQGKPAGEGADRFHYRITVVDGAEEQTVEVDESAVPGTLQPLIRRLTVLARTSRGAAG